MQFKKYRIAPFVYTLLRKQATVFAKGRILAVWNQLNVYDCYFCIVVNWECFFCRFIVRDFVYSEEEVLAGKNELSKLESDKKKQFVCYFLWPSV